MQKDPLLDILGHLAENMSGATNAEEVLAALLEGARGLLPFTAGALALRTPAEWRVWRATAARPARVSYNDNVPAAAAETLDRFLEHGQLLRVNDLLAPPWSQANHRDVLWKDGTRSALLVPLRTGGATVGTLSFTSAHPDQYPSNKDPIATFLGWMVACTLRALPQSEGAL
ncbi:MAG: GAF domain-containing protein [Ardenticatenaceae bacterium]